MNDCTTESRSQFASFLKALRLERQLSLRQLAAQAGISQGTLSGWETGKHLPRLTELTSVFDVLQTQAKDRKHALGLIRVPRSDRKLHQENPYLIRLEKELGTLPGMGALLRAIRHRRRLHIDHVAGALNVSAATISRWETGKAPLPPEQYKALLALFCVRPEERTALAEMQSLVEKGLYRQGSYRHSLEEWERIRAEYSGSNTAGIASRIELQCLLLETQAWQLASYGESGRILLAEIFAKHADVLSSQKRWSETRLYADRALTLLPSGDMPRQSFWVYALFASINSEVYGRRRRNPGRAVRRLKEIQSFVRQPHLEAWLYSRLSEYHFLDGHAEESLYLAKSAYRRAIFSEKSDEIILRQVYLAETLRDTGYHSDALMLIASTESENPTLRVRLLLIQTELLLTLNDPTEAYNCLQQALKPIELYDMVDLRKDADKLSTRF